MSRPSWWSQMTGAADRELVALLGQQLDIARQAAEVALRLVRGELDADTARAEASSIESRGDELRREVVQLLSELLTTPLDREDLYRLSRSLEDVIDNLRDLAREAALLGVGEDAVLRPVVDAVVTALQRLDEPISLLPTDLGGTRAKALLAQHDINGVRRAYQQGLAELYAQPLEIVTLKRRDLLRRLDVVGLRLGEAVAALADGALKRGH
jgi:uncharacterized protein